MSVPPDKVAKTPADKLEDIIKTFEAANKTAKDNPGQVLRDLIASSPALKKQLEDAVDKGELTVFKGLPAGTNAGGQYYGTTMEIPIDRLNKAAKDKAAANEMVFVLGHETRHGLNNPAEKKALETFEKDLKAIAEVKGGKHDYTKPVGDYIQHYRDNEAGAHLSGWNALSSKLAKEKGAAPSLQDMYDANPGRMQDFIDRTGSAPKFGYAMKPGLTVDKDMQLPLDAANIKAMGGYYFDKPLSQGRLGTNGNQNYPNYYGDVALNRVQAWEKAYNDHYTKLDSKFKPAEVQVDLSKLGLSATVLTSGLTYTDTTPKKPIDLSQEARPESSSRAEPALYGQAMKALDGIQGQLGLRDPTELRNVAAAAALQAQTSGMEKIDGALIGKNGQVFVYQGDPQREHVDRIAIDVAQAKLKPADQSLVAMAPDAQTQGVAAPTPQRSQIM
jgi:hypothetical protein